MSAYPIGETVYHNGDACKITGQPYTLYGAEWQDAEREDGRTVTIKTPAQKAADAAAKQAEWHAQQADFRKLKGTQ